MRHGIIMPVAAIVVVAAALVTVLSGYSTAAVIGLAVAVAVLVVVERRRPAPGPPPVLDPEEMAELRDERGEIAAIRRLRNRYPGVSLVQAAELVRGL